MPFETHTTAASDDSGAMPGTATYAEEPMVAAGGEVAHTGSDETAAETAVSHTSDNPAESVAPVWLQRASLLVLVLFCVYLGVLVAVLPWWTRVWDQNPWIESRPALAAVLQTGTVRGLISGLGLLDIWIGISEAVHYRDHRP